VRSSLTLLAALGAALALAGPGGGAPGEPGPSGDGVEPGLDPNVALEIRAARPAQTLPGALRTLAAEAPSPAVARAIRAGLAAPSRAGLELERLLASFSYVALTLERSCPPPALLACRPAVRFTGRLAGAVSPGLERDLRAVLLAGLRAAGFENLHARKPGDDANVTGRISSRGETLARWRIDDGLVEIATGGLALQGTNVIPAPTVSIETNQRTLAALLGD
jgi:hypothetical protein